MAVLTMAYPVLPGKEAAVRQFAKDMQSKKKLLEKSYKRFGIKKESWFLQTTPQGSWLLDNFEAKDMNAVQAGFAKSTDLFDVWVKDQIEQLTAPLTGPLPELLLLYGY